MRLKLDKDGNIIAHYNNKDVYFFHSSRIRMDNIEDDEKKITHIDPELIADGYEFRKKNKLSQEYKDEMNSFCTQELPNLPDDAFKSSKEILNKINLSERNLYKDESGFFKIRNGEKYYPSNLNKGENKMRESIANVYENTKDAVLVDKWFGDCRSFTDGCLKNESFLTELFFKANKEAILAKAKEWEEEEVK